jgi:hypothetical protein
MALRITSPGENAAAPGRHPKVAPAVRLKNEAGGHVTPGQGLDGLGSLLAEILDVAAIHDAGLLYLMHILTVAQRPIMGRGSQKKGVKRPNRSRLYDLLILIGEIPKAGQGL